MHARAFSPKYIFTSSISSKMKLASSNWGYPSFSISAVMSVAGETFTTVTSCFSVFFLPLMASWQKSLVHISI